MWHQFSNCYPPTCTRLALQKCPDEAAPTDLTRLSETSSMIDIWLVPHKWLWGCMSISFAKNFVTEGSNRGATETIAEFLWLYVHRHRNGSISKALAAT